MDVAQAFKEAQTATTETEAIPSALRQVELPALPIENRKSDSYKHSGHVISSLADVEENLSARQDFIEIRE